MTLDPAIQTHLGKYYVGDSSTILSEGSLAETLRGKVNLVVTSPPFPLNSKKSYGNYQGGAYLEWFSHLAPLMSDLLADDGSLVIEMGNAWEAGRPVQSTLHLEALLSLVKHPTAALNLCQQFVCYNPARLPSPAQWVTIERNRLTDSYTHVWWLARTDRPKADNRKVLRPYSSSMKALLQRKSYNHGRRPSQHVVSETSFLQDNGGAISHNFLELEPMDSNPPRLPNALKFANTQSNGHYLKKCREEGIVPHPARMPDGLVAFFIEFLTEPGDLVLDPFAGSGTTACVAEALQRKWLSVEIKNEYAEHARIRLSEFSDIQNGSVIL